MIDFETLILPRSPNAWLLAPRDLCRQAAPHTVAPVYIGLVGDMREALMAAMAAEPRTTLAAQDEAGERFAFVARSRLMGFRDDIDLRILPQRPGLVAFALYSRSRVGYSDMGVNAARGRRILAFVGGRLPRAG